MRPWLFIFTALLVASLTFMGQASGTSNQWSGTTDAFSRVSTENNNTILSSTYGHVNGQATLTATLDNQPMAITAVGTNAMVWNAQMELTPGQHQLIIAAAHPSGQFTAYATNTFTNSIAYQTTADTYDGAGNVTNRIWLNPNGTTNRIETFSWDARGRLHARTERDANNSGYNWSAIYDALSRRLSITSFAVTNGLVLSTLPNTINSYYDPQVEFLELGVAYGTKMVWKLYGPDADGTYGGENGTGGWDGISPGLGLFDPTLSDVHGNILGMITNSGVMLNSARVTAYGAVPGYRPVPLANGASLIQSSAMGGRWSDIDGDYNIGRRLYRPPSAEWETYDPFWNERDPNGYTYCGDDPANHGDWNGMLATVYGISQINNNPLGQLQSAAGYLNNYNNSSSAGGAMTAISGTLLNELAGMGSPSTYAFGAASFANNINTINNDSGPLIATSYALLGWNVGGMVSGLANENLVTGEPVGDWYQRGTEISAGVATTAGLAAGGLRIYNWATVAANVPPVLVRAATGDTVGIWDSIKATQPVYDGTVIPRSFELSTRSGDVWVHGNATEHLAEYATSMLNRGVGQDLVNTASQTQLQSLQAAVSSAIANGVPYNQLINVGGWELKFAAPRAAGQLPALIHAMPK